MVKPIEKWATRFGDDYHARNDDPMLAARYDLFSAIIRDTMWAPPASILEVGAGRGYNLEAINRLYVDMRVDAPRMLATEPNASAVEIINKSMEGVSHFSVMENVSRVKDRSVELAFTCGVLIHVPPTDLVETMAEIYRCSNRWIAAIEYFSPEPRALDYRGHPGMLWTGDFGSLWLDAFPRLRFRKCGFAWKRSTGLDNLTWWLFEK